jgi:DNA polymerase-3 subunit alpha
VTNFERRTSKRGNTYANFTLEDLSGSVQCSLFGNAYTTYNQVLYDNVIAKISARYEPGSDGRTSSVVVNEVTIVDALAKERYAQFFESPADGEENATHDSAPNDSVLLSQKVSHTEALILKLSLNDCFEDRLARLKSVLLQYPGEQPVFLKLHDGSATIKQFQLGDQYRVKDNPALRNQIYNILKLNTSKVGRSVWEDNALVSNSF